MRLAFLLHAAEFRPITAIHIVQCREQHLDRDAVDSSAIENGMDVTEQSGNRVLVAATTSKENGGVARKRAPRQRTGISNTNQRSPIVGDAGVGAEQFIWQLRVGIEQDARCP